MLLHWGLMLVSLCGSVAGDLFEVDINMAGVKGSVKFDSSTKIATVNLTGTCNVVNISLNEFPVMFGHYAHPCLEMNLGKKVYKFSSLQIDETINVTDLFHVWPNLVDLSLIVEQSCNISESRACSVVRKSGNVKTWQAKFYSPVAGNVYIRQNEGEDQIRFLSDLVDITKIGSLTNVSVYMQSGPSSCDLLISSLNKSALLPLGIMRVGSNGQTEKSRIEVANLTGIRTFALLGTGTVFACAEIRKLEPKEVTAVINMKGIKGTIIFSQTSPFESTELKVSLSNLRNSVGPYHVHQFPVPPKKSSNEDICSNDNVGGHWNPYNLDTKSFSYPTGPGATHDRYEIGDLSGKHGSLKDKDWFSSVYIDWNLPLFGRNSIVGRSVVIHLPNGTRLACGSIGYPGEIITAVALLRGPVIGTVIFSQLKSNPYSDMSIFMEVSTSNDTASKDHGWHVHEYPISSETDTDLSACQSTKGHYNPFKIETSANSNYSLSCQPDCPFACEVGDFSGKHFLLNLSTLAGKVQNKNFFTDTTSSLAGITSVLGRSLIIHGADRNPDRIACANITSLHQTSARTGNWSGVGSANGRIIFTQNVFLQATSINVSLSNLKSLAGGYHVHILPLGITGQGVDPCSDERIMGHFNPFSVNQSLSPPPANGTNDQYEIGDLSGKFGHLKNLNQLSDNYVDNNLPLSGLNSIIGRSLVIHYADGKRLQCADIVPDKASDGEWVRAKAVFGSTVKGTISMVQQIFSDGSFSDTIINVDLQGTPGVTVTEALWYIHINQTKENDKKCTEVGDHFNPYGLRIGGGYYNSCFRVNPLNCEVGDLNSKQGPVSLGIRQLYTDANLPLAGDFTAIYRSIVLYSKTGVLGCAAILPESPAAVLTFPTIKSFSRFEFRSAVSSVLQIPQWRVTILPGAPSLVNQAKCQQVNFFIAGNINVTRLSMLKYEEKLGKFKQTKLCAESSSGLAAFSQFMENQGNILILFIVAIQLFL
ncbi:uncharacterized protein cusr [Erpetoichthys calabaricus]|uniref:uncharacterized protein cusr n=1 Tax=Erpetoichthys calabaricus TaxID=27687 RepID=UPI0022347998|nr:uncharacterized protein cusr [Erpetoichthys calabaricus]